MQVHLSIVFQLTMAAKMPGGIYQAKNAGVGGVGGINQANN